MSKIVELKIGEIENVVGGVKMQASAAVATANAPAMKPSAGSLNASVSAPVFQRPTPDFGSLALRR